MNIDQISIEQPNRELDAYIYTMVTGKSSYGKSTAAKPNYNYPQQNYSPRYSAYTQDALHLIMAFYDSDIGFYHFGDQGLWCRIKVKRIDEQGNAAGWGEEYGPAIDFCLLVCRTVLVAYQRLDRQHYEDDGVMKPAENRKIKQ